MSDNAIIYFAKLNFVIFLWPLLFFFSAFFLGSYFPQLNDFSLIIIGLSLLWGFFTWVTYYFSSLTISQNQVTIRTGILVRQTVDISMSKIESMDIRQTLLGSLLQYGTLIITGTGGTHNSINYLAKPLTCRRYIEQLMHRPA